jgi:hypothetical protein
MGYLRKEHTKGVGMEHTKVRYLIITNHTAPTYQHGAMSHGSTRQEENVLPPLKSGRFTNTSRYAQMLLSSIVRLYHAKNVN